MTQEETLVDGVYSPNLMRFVVGNCTGHTDDLPDVMLPFEPIPEDESVQTNEVALAAYPQPVTCGDPKVWLMDGLGWDDITVFVALNSTQTWIFVRVGSLPPPALRSLSDLCSLTHTHSPCPIFLFIIYYLLAMLT